MGALTKPHRVKLIVGLIYKETPRAQDALVRLVRRFGAIDFESPEIAFNHTAYYEKEFGSGLKRKFISFKSLILPDSLSPIKITTNKIEARLTIKGMRSVNIDPGYLDLARLILASTKDHAHRIYLHKGIHAEITLIYHNKTFSPCEWTYPDFRTPPLIQIFNAIRKLYAAQKRV